MNTQLAHIKSSMTGKKIGNVTINEPIGEGSVGVVYKGYHSNLGIDVAVKFMKDEFVMSSDPSFVDRFLREARIAAQLHHSGITRTIDCGFHEGHLYIVLEYIDGFTLSDYVRGQKDNVSEDNVLKLIISVTSALSKAHASNIIHRDLKPSNIMISKQGSIFITDLGLAREVNDVTITRTHIVVGSPAYMSPESFDEGTIPDFRSDIYSLGCLVYYTAFKTLPVTGKTIHDVINGHLSGNIDFDLPTACGEDVIELIRRMMAHKVEDRFQTSNNINQAAKHILTKRKTSVVSTEDNAIYEVKDKNTSAGIESYPSYTQTDTRINIDSIAHMIDNCIGAKTSELSGSPILHSTILERLILWGIFICFIGLGIFGYISS